MFRGSGAQSVAYPGRPLRDIIYRHIAQCASFILSTFTRMLIQVSSSENESSSSRRDWNDERGTSGIDLIGAPTRSRALTKDKTWWKIAFYIEGQCRWSLRTHQEPLSIPWQAEERFFVRACHKPKDYWKTGHFSRNMKVISGNRLIGRKNGSRLKPTASAVAFS